MVMADVPIGSGKRRIIREFPSQGSHDSAAGVVGKVEERVHVRQKVKTNRHGRPRRFRNASPDVSFLRVCGEGVMIAVKGEESAELHPTVTEFFVRVTVEATGVDAEHWNAEEGEAQGLRLGGQMSALKSGALCVDRWMSYNREEHIRPQARIVAAPVASPLASTGKSRPADDERTFAGYGGEKSIIRGIEDLETEQIVHIILFDTTHTPMCCIG